MKNNLKNLCVALLSSTALISCGGGGGGGSGGGGSTGGGGELWQVSAPVATDTCHERISGVQQTFSVSGTTVNTSIITLSGVRNGNNLVVAFEETNGDCVRNYEAQLNDMSGSNANVNLISKTTCPTQTCESTWIGTATRIN